MSLLSLIVTRPRSTRTHRGFTLLEVTIAIVILSGIIVACWLSFDGLAKMKETVEVTEKTSYTARVALQRITRELRMSFLTLNPNPLSYLTLFFGQNQDPGDMLTFNSFSHIRMYRESNECDTTEIAYFVEPDPDNPGLMMLLHREAPRIDEKPEEDGVVEVLARRVVFFNLRYFDITKQEWSDLWDTTAAEFQFRLPRAVEILLVLADLDGVEHYYATTVLLPMYKTRGAYVLMTTEGFE